MALTIAGVEVAAWFNSRHVVDAGHRFEKPAPTPAPAAK
jgi:hypothetical protein